MNIPENVGTYVAANTLIGLAHGSLITRFDADDLMLPGRLLSMVRAMLQDPELDAVNTRWKRMDENMDEVLRLVPSAPDGTWMYRRSSWDKAIGGFRSWPCAADTDSLDRGAANGLKYCVVPEYTYLRRQHPESLTQKSDTGIGSSTRKRLRKLLEAARTRYGRGEVPGPLNLVSATTFQLEGPLFSSVTASLASIPARKELLQQVVAALLPQVDRLNVYLNGYSEVPPFLVDARICVGRGEDLGDAGKFFWAGAVRGYHLTCDDDILYPLDYVSRMVEAIEGYSRSAVISYHGSLISKNFHSYRGPGSRKVIHFEAICLEDTSVHLGGTGVMGYHAQTLPVHVSDFRCPNIADVWMGALTQKSRVPIVSPAKPEGWIRGLSDTGLYDESSDTLVRRRDREISNLLPWSTFMPKYSERSFWDRRYREGGNSGAGSRGQEAIWKAEKVVRIARRDRIHSILDFGSGDGHVARAVVRGLPGSVSYRGVDISPTTVLAASKGAPGNMTFEVADITEQFEGSADMVLCLDVLFHLSTAEKHRAAIDVICRSFRSVAIVAAWNESILQEYGGKFADHTFFRPFEVPDGIEVFARVIPSCPSKTLYVLHHKEGGRLRRRDLYKTKYTQGADGPRKLHDSWHRGEQSNFIASGNNLKEPGALHKYVLKGWAPSRPVIKKTDKILAVGSCFAMHIASALRKLRADVVVNQGKTLGKGKGAGTSDDINLFTFGAGFVNTYSVLQQFEWALGKREIGEANLYVQRPQAEPGAPRSICLMPLDEHTQKRSRDTIMESDAFIITLGLSEAWYDKVTGEVFFGAVPEHKYDPERHEFRVMSVKENRENLEGLYRLIREIKPRAPIVFTLSPVPLIATFRPVSCMTANSVSKAVLRAAVDEFLRGKKDNRLFYWPSYEVVLDFFGPDKAYKEDRRHIKPEVVMTIMKAFADAFVERK